MLLVAGAELVPALGATVAQYSAATSRFHPLAETVFVGALALAGLVGTFHGRRLSLIRSSPPRIRRRGRKCKRIGLASKQGSTLPEAKSLQAVGSHLAILGFHDQATIASKLLDFGDAVNVTLGLPVIRTSVDHGTGADIAGRGVAEPGGMIAAIELALHLVEQRRRVGR